MTYLHNCFINAPERVAIRTLLVFFMGLVVASTLYTAQAAVPTNINYQGFLADDSGTPINSAQFITFRLYSTDTGGTALWSEGQAVPVSEGRFTVELGSVTAFQSGLFDGSALFLSLEVNADGEMSPRQPLSSTPYAYKAQDSDTLGGMVAASFDQSAHVSNTANPHAVTAAQAGAASTTALNDHEADTTNPHSVTAAQSGAVSNAELITHTSNSSAHHTKYLDAEAVSAMGIIANGNPLNHDKYQDTNAVAAIQAADGAGSSLDADLLDGQHATDIIDAASDEVRKPISNLPYTINSSGSYYLTDNLTATLGAGNRGIDVLADRVVIDFMGFTLDGASADDYGIDVTGQHYVVIKNGFLKRFLKNAIQDSVISSVSEGIVVQDMTITGFYSPTPADIYGIRLPGSIDQILGKVVSIER